MLAVAFSMVSAFLLVVVIVLLLCLRIAYEENRDLKVPLKPITISEDEESDEE